MQRGIPSRLLLAFGCQNKQGWALLIWSGSKVHNWVMNMRQNTSQANLWKSIWFVCVCQSRHSGDLLHVLPLKVKTSSASIKSYILIVAEANAFIFFLWIYRFYMLHHTFISPGHVWDLLMDSLKNFWQNSPLGSRNKAVKYKLRI